MKKNEFTLNTTVLSGQCDSLMRFRAEAAFMTFQDVASRHAILLGVDDFSLLEKDNALWVITKTKVKVNRLPLWNEDVEVRTWPMGAEGVRCNRCYQIIKDGEILINGITEWVIIDASTRTLRKVETTSYPNDVDWIKEKSIEDKFRRFKDDFTEDDFVYKRLIRSGDIDVTHHVNNVTYITMLLDTFSVNELESMTLKEIEISYISETLEGETLSIYKKETDEGFCFKVVKDDGKVAVMAYTGYAILT